MTQIQNHGGTERLYVVNANALTKDKAVSKVQVDVDTSLWSSRKRNIIVNSLRTGIAACGYETAQLVEALARTVGSNVNTISRWCNYVYKDEVKPDMMEELLAYTSAWVRIRAAAVEDHRYYYVPHYERQALQAIRNGDVPHLIPLNDAMTYDEKREFIHKYLKASEDREAQGLVRLIEAIERGETLTVTFEK